MHRRIQIATDPVNLRAPYGFGAPPLPARWLGPATFNPDVSKVLLFRRSFELAAPTKLKMHIAADQRYELSVDGQYLGRGPERGDLRNWYYETYELDLPAGQHQLLVRVWWLAVTAPAPEAQQTYRPALLVYGEGSANELISTGVADWQMVDLPGYSFKDHDRLHAYFATGAELHIDGLKVDTAAERGEGDAWTTPGNLGQVCIAARREESAPWWVLRPATLPPMYEKKINVGVARHVEAVDSDQVHDRPIDPAANLADEQDAWNRLLKGKEGLTVPANTRRRVLIDLDNYYCAYPLLRCCGAGARIRFHSAESLYHVTTGSSRNSRNSKGNRDEINGKCFYGVGYHIVAGRECFTYSPHAFIAGRYLELLIETGDEPLKIDALEMLDTHYPFKFKAKYASSDPVHKQIIPIALRTLEMCSHDTSMDCPYYERLNYIGDTRLQSLVAYVAADDDRLSRRCIELFDLSRQPSGLTSSRYPTRTVQTIPTFSLWWADMVYDYALWRDDLAFVAARMNGVRTAIDYWRSLLDAKSGLIRCSNGWNFADWVTAWGAGVPADGHHGFNSIINLQVVYTLRLVAQVEDLLGEPALAKRHRDFATRLAAVIKDRFLDRAKGLFADDLKHEHFSQHAQCMAVLSGTVTGTAAKKLIAKMLATPDLYETTVYFSHYLFETLGEVGEIDALLARLDMWKTLVTGGFRTTFEMPEPTRSDCHAWGAHPVYHFLATIAGIRPAVAGFKQAIIRPQLGSLTSIKGSLPHANGAITFDLAREGAKLTGLITLPKDLPATLKYNGAEKKLKAGENKVRI